MCKDHCDHNDLEKEWIFFWGGEGAPIIKNKVLKILYGKILIKVYFFFKDKLCQEKKPRVQKKNYEFLILGFFRKKFKCN